MDLTTAIVSIAGLLTTLAAGVLAPVMQHRLSERRELRAARRELYMRALMQAENLRRLAYEVGLPGAKYGDAKDWVQLRSTLSPAPQLSAEMAVYAEPSLMYAWMDVRRHFDWVDDHIESTEDLEGEELHKANTEWASDAFGAAEKLTHECRRTLGMLKDPPHRWLSPRYVRHRLRGD